MSETIVSGTINDNAEAIHNKLDEKSFNIDFIDETLKIVESSDQAEKTPERENSIKAKKCVTFNPNDEKIRKFTTGEPIVDQQNPFKNGHLGGREKKTPPPVPTKRSTLSVRKTVTQQLREREREKEKEKERERERDKDKDNDKEKDNLRDKEREQLKNEANARKKLANKSNLAADEFITTEEVLKQSKYVKTYIKNPDAYFVYDPTVLARLKFEELRDIAGKIPKRKPVTNPTNPAGRSQKEAKGQARLAKQLEAANGKPKVPTFKKCSKPNYPELANLKIRTGTDSNGDYFNPAEVTKNAKKFDERVKKLQISSDDDLDEIDGPLTKSDSSDELNQPQDKEMTSNGNGNGNGNGNVAPLGTFTNTISSEEFQAYLERKGLALMPKQRATTTTVGGSPASTSGQTAEERRQQVAESLAALRKSSTKKLSVLQRLSNSLFATRRKTTPKAASPLPRTVYGDSCDAATKLNTPAEMRRILLESQPNGPMRAETGTQPQPRPAIRTSVQLPLERAPLQRSSAERQSLIPRRVSPETQPGRFQRTASMDRNQIRAGAGPRTLSRLESVGQRRSVAASTEERQIVAQPMATSTPQRGQAKEWEQLRAIKEVTDRQLYHKVLQQQQQQQQQPQPSEENIYEHLQSQQLQGFVRGSLQRNTFSGISGRNRQVMILDGAPIARPAAVPAPRCQSVLDELITPGATAQATATRRGYESENETPVVLRRKETSATGRRIGGLLTRDEILEKVKEFCRKSINRAPLPAAKMQPIYERHNNNNNNGSGADISPVSYASVETHSRRPGSQLSARPQVPLRVQSLPRSSYVNGIGNGGNSASPIYAHVNKRNSLLSNESEQYVSSQQLRQLPNQSLLTLTPTEYVLIQTEDGLQAAKLIDCHNGSLYMQPHYIRASPQGYVRIEELAQAQQQLQNGRATPLILDRAGQQASQIYWTPQQQQQQQNQHGQLAMQKSPRMYPIPAPRMHLPQNYVLANGQPYATVMSAPRNLAQQQQQLGRNASDWDCSSEAGEIRRIMEKSF